MRGLLTRQHSNEIQIQILLSGIRLLRQFGLNDRILVRLAGIVARRRSIRRTEIGQNSFDRMLHLLDVDSPTCKKVK